MALRDKLNILAATASGKANTAIETGKLNLKINSEEKKIAEYTQNIGELIVDKLDIGETFDDEVMALYMSIKGSRETIASLKSEIDSLRQIICPGCGAVLGEKDNFCANCGMKVERTPEDAEPVAEPVPASEEDDDGDLDEIAVEAEAAQEVPAETASEPEA